MAKKGETKSTEKTSVTVADDILGKFGVVGEPFDAGAKTDAVAKVEDKGTKGEDAAALEDLTKKVAELSDAGTKRDDTIERLQNLNMQLMAGKGGIGDTITAPEATPVDMSGLPSAAEDPDGFSKGLHERLGVAITKSVESITAHERATAAQANERTSRTAGLWDEFTERFPELDDYQDYVEVAATKVAKRASRRGLDLDTYMFKGSDQFLADVAEEAGKIVTPLREAAKAKGDGDDKAPADPDKKGDGDDGPDRTGGIFGGLDGQGGPGGEEGGEEPEASSLIKDLEAIQLKTGYY